MYNGHFADVPFCHTTVNLYNTSLNRGIINFGEEYVMPGSSAVWWHPNSILTPDQLSPRWFIIRLVWLSFFCCVIQCLKWNYKICIDLLVFCAIYRLVWRIFSAYVETYRKKLFLLPLIFIFVINIITLHPHPLYSSLIKQNRNSAQYDLNSSHQNNHED